MPRKAVASVKGKTWQEFAEMSTQDFNTLSVAERQAIIDKVGHAANTRYQRFIKSDEITPAVREMIDSGGRITAHGKTEGQLATEFARAKRFLTRKTSTRSGWSDTKKQIIKSLKENGVNIKTMKQFKKFWKVYNELSENDSRLEDKKARYKVMEEIANNIRKGNMDFDAMIDAALARLDEIYRAGIDAMNDPRLHPL